MKEMLVSIQHSAPLHSPFEGRTSPLCFRIPPFEGGLGGMFLYVLTFVIQSVSEESLSVTFGLTQK